MLADRLPEWLGRLPGPELTPALANTQEQAWAVAAAAALGRDGRPIRVAVNGRGGAAGAAAGGGAGRGGYGAEPRRGAALGQRLGHRHPGPAGAGRAQRHADQPANSSTSAGSR